MKVWHLLDLVLLLLATIFPRWSRRKAVYELTGQVFDSLFQLFMSGDPVLVYFVGVRLSLVLVIFRLVVFVMFCILLLIHPIPLLRPVVWL